MKKKKIFTPGKTISLASMEEKKRVKELRNLNSQFQKIIKDAEWNLNNFALFSNRQSLSRFLYYNEIYKLILKKPGSIIEFGVQYGSTLSFLLKLRGIYEPFNHTRKIFGFDTFKGFSKSFNKEEKKIGFKEGDYGVSLKNYDKFLEKVILNQESNSPIGHIKKFQLIKGDVIKTFPKFLQENKHLLLSLVIFDMDLYKPTISVLKKIKPRLYKGTVIVFDELNCDFCPGETQAVLKTLGFNNLKLKNFHGQSYSSYAIYGE